MPVTYEIAIAGYDKLKERLDSTLLVRAAAGTFTSKAAARLRRDVAAGAPKDTTALSRSFSARVSSMEASVTSTSAYVMPVEGGRAPGAGVPPGALRGWLARHGINPHQEYVVARAIKRRGIRGRFFIQAALARAVQYTPTVMQEAADAVTKFWTSGDMPTELTRRG